MDLHADRKVLAEMSKLSFFFSAPKVEGCKFIILSWRYRVMQNCTFWECSDLANVFKNISASKSIAFICDIHTYTASTQSLYKPETSVCPEVTGAAALQ